MFLGPKDFMYRYKESFMAIAQKTTAIGSIWLRAHGQIFGAPCAKSIKILSKNPIFEA